MSNQRYGSNKTLLIGEGIAVDLANLDPSVYEGAVVYSGEQLYFSDGSNWLIPQEQTDISRPRGLAPTNSVEQTQLRLSLFNSPSGETQTGIIFEISTDGIPAFGEGDNYITRTVTSETANLYQILYPEDGFVSGDNIWWRAKYLGSNSTQSEFSTPIAQIYPELIDNPLPVTRQGAISGAVEITPFSSPFGLQYVNTQWQFWDEGDDPSIDPPVAEVTDTLGASVLLPGSLTEGGNYLWHGRYGANATGVGAPTVFSEYTAIRTVNKGAGSIVLRYDPALALNRTIYLPMGIYGGVVDVTVDWGDGLTDTYGAAGNRSHVYAAGVTGTVDVVISGQLEQIGGNANQNGLVRVVNIGFALGLTSLREAFRNTTSNLSQITNAMPPQVTNMQGMFYSSNLTADISNLDVSNVTNMSLMFRNATAFNQDIGAWNVSSVTDMNQMFNAASAFNQPIGAWNVSSVTDMSLMFRNATAFNQNINSWDVSSVVNMSNMFASLLRSSSMAFNQDIGSWNVSSVTDMERMFANTVDSGGSSAGHAFNNGGVDSIKNWDVSNVTNFSTMFGHTNATKFNQPLTGWNLSSATNVADMFRKSPFNNDVTGWVLPTSLEGLFRNASAFNHPSIGSWDVSSVTDMSYMFNAASAFNHPSIGSWDVSSVTDMSYMFNAASAFNQNINSWDVSSVVNMSNMFESSLLFDQPLNLWDTSSVKNMSYMFALVAGGSNTTLLFNQNINEWDTSNVTDMSYMFAGAYSGFANKRSLFNSPIGGWDVSSVTSMQGMFARTGTTTGFNSFNQDISQWKLNPNGVILIDFMRVSGGTLAFSTENYSKLLAGWANTVDDQDGPYFVTLGAGGLTYNTTDYFVGERFEDAVEGRTYLTNSNRVEVASASTADADGTYFFDAGLAAYVKANDWYFVKESGVWLLKDDLDATQATQQDAGDLSGPQLVVTWDGVLASATVLRNGAVWTITDGGAA